jgi:hypothetical protein
MVNEYYRLQLEYWIVVVSGNDGNGGMNCVVDTGGGLFVMSSWSWCTSELRMTNPPFFRRKSALDLDRRAIEKGFFPTIK